MDLGLFCNQYAIQLGITLLSLRLAVRQSRNLTFAHIGTYTVFSAEANIRRTRGTSQDKITTKVSHSHKAHGGYEEPQAVSKMPVYHFRSQESAFRREKFVRSDFFSAKAEKSLEPKQWPNRPNLPWSVGNSAERWLDFGTCASKNRSNP